MRYLQYEKRTGKICGSLRVDGPELPEVYENETLCGYLPVDENLHINAKAYIVQNGELVKAYETGEERRNREKAEKEQHISGYRQLKALAGQLAMALLFDDEEEVERIKAAANALKAYRNI